MKKLIIPFLISVSFMISCKSGSASQFQVKVSFQNADKLAAMNPGIKTDWVFLEEIVYGKAQLPKIIDSAKISGSGGSFTLTGKSKVEGIYELIFGENTLAIPLINDASDIQLDADLSKTKDFYTISGSPASKQLQ